MTLARSEVQAVHRPDDDPHAVGKPTPLLHGWLYGGLFVALLLCAEAPSRQPQGAAPWQIPAKYGRRNDGRSKLENRKVAETIALGLEWLRRHQDKDGKWDSDEFMKHDKTGIACTGAGKMQHDPGLTGLALLCFLAEGNSINQGLYKSQVSSAAAWLITQQDKRGRIGFKQSADFIYEHAIATLALVEAYGLCGDAGIKSAAVAGIRYLEAHRNKGAAWRYQPRDKQNDSSVAGWALLACLGARDFGIDVPAELFNEVDAWFLSLTDKKSGRSGYEVPGTLPVRSAEALQSFPPGKSESLTAISLFCRLMLGHRAQKEPLLHTQARLIDKKLPRWDEDGGSIDMYYWYYGSLAQRQMGEPYWSKWYAALSKVLLAAQRRDGNSTGSFDPVGAWGKDGGRIYSTCMSLLSLQAAYRYEVLAELTPFPSGPLYRSVRKHWREERYDRVHAFLRKQRAGSLSTGQDKRLHKAERALQERIDEATAYVAAISPRTRFFAAKKRLEGIKKDFGSLEAGKAAKAQLELFRRDKAIARELKAGEELEKLRKNFATAKPRQLAKLESAVEKLLTKYKNSQVSAETKALLREIAAAIKKN